jgi:hypothetical protein
MVRRPERAVLLHLAALYHFTAAFVSHLFGFVTLSRVNFLLNGAQHQQVFRIPALY